MKIHRPAIAACALILAITLGGAASACASAGPTPVAETTSADAAATPGWAGSWAASPMAPTSLVPNRANAGFAHQTVRNIVFSSVGGDQVRIRLSNTFGAHPLQVGGTSVGIVQSGAQLVAGTTHPVTFDGRATTTIPAGAEAVSDPVPLKVAPLQHVAVSTYLPEATGPATFHKAAQQIGYLASGDHASEPEASAYTGKDASWYFLDGLQVHDPTAPGTVAAIGDSITDGHTSKVGADHRWPNFLARRLDSALGDKAPAVEDEGIGGNRVLHDSACFGVSALERFQRDVLAQPGVKDVIMLEGTNDIGFSQGADKGCAAPNTDVTAAQIVAGYRKLIDMAHARGLKMFGATITPFKGSAHWSQAAEAKRDAVNKWIQTSHAFDGVVDFAGAVQAPGDPLSLNPSYNSGDSLHPNDAGYQAMAAAINLGLLQ